VIFGYNRVVIYVEPEATQGLKSNTARTHLLVNREPLPWADWAAEFRAAMPPEIEQLMESVIAGSSSADHKQAIRDRLKQIRDLFKLSRYRRTPAGATKAKEDTVGGKSGDSATTNGGNGRGGSKGGRAGDIYALFIADDGDPADAVNSDVLPDVVWVSVEDGTREPDFLEDRAAKFLPEKNLLQINGDFRVYTDMEDRWCMNYADAPNARIVVRDVVREWFEQALVEAVLGVQSLHGSQEWPVDAMGRAMSEEALTAAVMQRYHIDVAVKRALGAKLGTLKDKAAA
jgi:hypothetical protein